MTRSLNVPLFFLALWLQLITATSWSFGSSLCRPSTTCSSGLECQHWLPSGRRRLVCLGAQKDSDNDNDNGTVRSQQQRQEDRLLSLLEFIQNREEGRLFCGLDATEKEQVLVASVIGQVEQDANLNKVVLQNGKIAFQELVGDWKLLYTSSRAMIINKSLSGLGRSASEYSQFISLVQKLGGNK
jgi:hypothetical protein